MKLNIQLTYKQALFIRANKRYSLLRCGRRAGKTHVSAYWLVKKALEKPNQNCWYLGVTLAIYRETILPIIKQMVPKELYKEKVMEASLEFTNGSVIHFKTIDTADGLRGRRIDAIVLDEAAFWPKLQYIWLDLILPSLGNGSAVICSSPNGNNFFKKLEDDADDEWYVDVFTAYDNPFYPKEAIERAKKSSPEDTWLQEWMAEYLDKVGTVYYEFEDSAIQTINPVNKLIVRGMDWGLDDDTACAWIHLLTDGRVYVSREYSQNNTDIPTIATALKEVNLPIHATIMDSSAFKRESDMHSVTDRFKVNGIFMIPATRNIEIGISAIKELINSNKLIIHPSCRNLINAFHEWNYSQHEPDIMAAFRYGISWLINSNHLVVDNFTKKKPNLMDIIKEQNRNINLQLRFGNDDTFRVYKGLI